MEANQRGVLVATSEQQHKLLDLVPAIKRAANVHVRYLLEMDSSDMQPEHWQLIANAIMEEYDKYDGFVVIHGHDTMAYTATALSFMFKNLGKPIILTDSVVPIDQLSPDNHANIVNAVRFACENIAEVAIVFGGFMLRGNRAKKTHDIALNAFLSPNLHPLGVVESTLILNTHCFRRHGHAPELNANLVQDVAVITLFPGITNSQVLNMVPPRTKGLVISGYGAGNIPLGQNGIQDAIQTIVQQDIVTVIDTQCIYGGVDYGRYVGGAFAKEHGALSSSDMTAEAAIIKLMWCLGQSDSLSEIKQLYTTNIAGELTD